MKLSIFVTIPAARNVIRVEFKPSTGCCPKRIPEQALKNHRHMDYFLPLPFIPSHQGRGIMLRAVLSNKPSRIDIYYFEI